MLRPEQRGAARVAVFGIGIIVVDIPIGLPDRGPRAADTLARARVGARASSVFPTPDRAALLAADYAAATVVSIQATGKGLSAQAYGLRHRILEVDAFLPRARVRLLEGHPEVTFAQMGGARLGWGKDSAAGVVERRHLNGRRARRGGAAFDFGRLTNALSPDFGRGSRVCGAGEGRGDRRRFSTGGRVPCPTSLRRRILNVQEGAQANSRQLPQPRSPGAEALPERILHRTPRALPGDSRWTYP